MSNGQSRVDKYANLSLEEHLHQLDNDLDTTDANREILLRSLHEESDRRYEAMEAAAEKRYDKVSKSLFWVLTTFVSLILLVCGTLLAVVLRT